MLRPARVMQVLSEVSSQKGHRQLSANRRKPVGNCWHEPPGQFLKGLRLRLRSVSLQDNLSSRVETEVDFDGLVEVFSAIAEIPTSGHRTGETRATRRWLARGCKPQ